MFSTPKNPVLSATVLLVSALGCAAPSPHPAYQSSDIQAAAVARVGPSFAGATVACVMYVNKTLSPYRTLGDASVGILPEYLIEAGFRPIEHSENAELESALSELRYGQSDRVDSATAAAIGQQLGARYVFVGEVNSYREVEGKGSRGVNVLGYGLSGGGSNITYDLQVSGRLIDVETREIMASKTVAHDESFEIQGGSISTPWGGFQQSQEIEIKQENSGKVLNHAFGRLVSQLVRQLNAR